MSWTRFASTLLLIASACVLADCSNDATSTPSYVRPVPPCSDGPSLADWSWSAPPNGTVAVGTPITITFTADVFVSCKSIGSTEPIYWTAKALVPDYPHSIDLWPPAPGSLAPVAGGPVPPRTPMQFTYQSPVAVDQVNIHVTFTAPSLPAGVPTVGGGEFQVHVK